MKNEIKDDRAGSVAWTNGAIRVWRGRDLGGDFFVPQRREDIFSSVTWLRIGQAGVRFRSLDAALKVLEAV